MLIASYVNFLLEFRASCNKTKQNKWQRPNFIRYLHWHIYISSWNIKLFWNKGKKHFKLINKFSKLSAQLFGWASGALWIRKILVYEKSYRNIKEINWLTPKFQWLIIKERKAVWVKYYKRVIYVMKIEVKQCVVTVMAICCWPQSICKLSFPIILFWAEDSEGY